MEVIKGREIEKLDGRPKKPSFSFSEIAKHAAKKAQRKIAKRQDDAYRISKLFKDNTNNYRIEKIREYEYDKFNTKRSKYKKFMVTLIFFRYKA